MASSPLVTLHTVCVRYGPGRLPKAEHHAIGAGYAAASAAVCAAILYAGVATVVDSVGLQAAEFANIALAVLALPFVVPGAFAVGFLGWNVRPLRSSVSGLIAGVLGAIGTYGVVLILFGVPVTALEGLSGADPIRAAVFSWGVIYFAFLETWWAALPIGAVSGALFVTVVSRVE